MKKSYPNFNGIKHFDPLSKVDQWGDASKMSPMALQKLDQLRDILKTAVFVTSAYRPNNKGSQHFFGHAFDIIVPGVDLIEIYDVAEYVGFTGIGIYPHWKFRSVEYGGLHVDCRSIKGRWMGVPDENGKQKYIALNDINLQAYGVI